MAPQCVVCITLSSSFARYLGGVGQLLTWEGHKNICKSSRGKVGGDIAGRGDVFAGAQPE